MMIEETKTSGTFISAVISGSPIQVDTVLRNYLKTYPYAGYMTEIMTDEQYVGDDEKTYRRVQLSRLQSCD